MTSSICGYDFEEDLKCITENNSQLDGNGRIPYDLLETVFISFWRTKAQQFPQAFPFVPACLLTSNTELHQENPAPPPLLCRALAAHYNTRLLSLLSLFNADQADSHFTIWKCFSLNLEQSHSAGFACVYLRDFQVGEVCSLSFLAVGVWVCVCACRCVWVCEIWLSNTTNIWLNVLVCFNFFHFWMHCRYTRIVRSSLMLIIVLYCYYSICILYACIVIILYLLLHFGFFIVITINWVTD